MGEKLIVSGRHIEGLYPHLDVWGFGIPLYLFIGGLAAGILIFATYFYINGKQKELTASVIISPLIVPVIIAIGLLFLIGDLHHKLYFWRLLTTFRIESPMSWGSWTLTAVMLLSIIWPLTFINEIIAYFEQNNRKKLASLMQKIKDLVEKFGFIDKIVQYATKNRKTLAYTILGLSIVLGIYTGILLSSFNARPLWNSPLLGLIFLTSGVSTGAAFNMWLSKDHNEKKLYSKIDIFLVATEILLIGLMFLAMIWGPQIMQTTAQMFFGGQFTAVFWGLFVFVGLIVPLVLEIMEFKNYHIPIAVPAFLILLGGLIFRMIMVTAGQISSYTF